MVNTAFMMLKSILKFAKLLLLATLICGAVEVPLLILIHAFHLQSYQDIILAFPLGIAFYIFSTLYWKPSSDSWWFISRAHIVIFAKLLLIYTALFFAIITLYYLNYLDNLHWTFWQRAAYGLCGVLGFAMAAYVHYLFLRRSALKAVPQHP